jgi:tetrahydromethanopterin S-methyltransferase subunit G
MAVMMPREKWTDDRLDDLNRKVDDGFARLDQDIRELRGDIKDLKGDINDVKRDINRTIYGAVAAVFLAQLGSSAFF